MKAIIGAVLIDGTGGPPASNSVVMISGSRIVATGPRTAFEVPQGAEQIDGSGKCIIPALIDVYIRKSDTVHATAAGRDYEGGVIGAKTSPEEARRLIAEFASAHRYMALIDGAAPATAEAALEEGRKNKLPVFARAGGMADVSRLMSGGVAGFVGMITETDRLEPALLGKMRDLRTIWVPVLSEQPAANLAIARRNTMQMASAGVPIAVGGASMDREIEILAEAGMLPGDIIVAATRTGAQVVRRSIELGTLQPGKAADLLLLPKNPIEDIRNLRSGGREMRDGDWVN